MVRNRRRAEEEDFREIKCTPFRVSLFGGCVLVQPPAPGDRCRVCNDRVSVVACLREAWQGQCHRISHSLKLAPDPCTLNGAGIQAAGGIEERVKDHD